MASLSSVRKYKTFSWEPQILISLLLATKNEKAICLNGCIFVPVILTKAGKRAETAYKYVRRGEKAAGGSRTKVVKEKRGDIKERGKSYFYQQIRITVADATTSKETKGHIPEEITLVDLLSSTLHPCPN